MQDLIDNELKNDPEQPTTNAQKGGDRVPHGRKIPVYNLEESVSAVIRIYENGGQDNTNEALAQLLDTKITSSFFGQRTAPLKSFGLLTTTKQSYSLTKVAIAIANPDSPDDRIRAIQEAFRSHEVLNKVWGFTKDKVLPQREFLANQIEKNAGVPPSLKLEWADYFIECGKFAKLLSEREQPGSYFVLGVYAPAQKDIEPQKVQEVTQLPADSKTERQDPPRRGSVENLSDGLTGGLTFRKKISQNRLAVFFVPEDLTQSDVDAVKSILKAIEAALEGLKTSEES